MRRALHSLQRDLYPLSFKFRLIPGVYGALSPLLPAGCCHLVFLVPYHSLLFHLSLFSVMALIRTAVVFLTLDRFPLLWCEHEDDRDTLCIVPEFKGAAASDVTDHSLLLSSSSDSLSPFIVSSLVNSLLLCVRCRTLTTEVNINDFGVRSPLNGLTIVILFDFKSLPKIRFKFVGAENHNRLHCTTHGTSILERSAMLKISFSCWKMVVDDTHS